jgi:hypothetical protein
MAGSSVPVIDISSLLLGGEERSATVARIGAACRDWGFFQVTGHPYLQTLSEESGSRPGGFLRGLMPSKPVSPVPRIMPAAGSTVS